MSQPPSDGDPTRPGSLPAWNRNPHPGSAQPPSGPGEGEAAEADRTIQFPQRGSGGDPQQGGRIPAPGQGGDPSGRDQTAQFPKPAAHPPTKGGGYPRPGQGGPYQTPGPGPNPTPGYPPPGPGAAPYGYGAPPPGYGAPPPGYGAPPPGYGAPPPGSGGRGRRNLIIALVAGLVVLAGVIVAILLVLNRDNGRVAAESTTTTASATPTATSAVTTTPSPTPSPTTTTPSTSQAAPTAAVGADDLLAVLPADFTDCTEDGRAGDGDVAAAVCGPATTQPGPQQAQFHLYEDAGTLDRVFGADLEKAAIEPLPEGEDCTTAQGYVTWNVDGVEGGQIACAITDEGVVIAWTDRDFLVEGIVGAPGTTQDDLAALADWWFEHSDYQG